MSNEDKNTAKEIVSRAGLAQWWKRSIPGPGVICGLTLLSVLYSAPRGFSPGTPVFPSSKTNISKFQFDLDVRHFSHEPLARVNAQALPVLDVKFHLHFHFYIYRVLRRGLRTSSFSGVFLN